MAFRFYLPIVFLIAITVSLAQRPHTLVPTAQPEEAGFSAGRLQRVDKLLQGFIDRGVAPNAVTFVARNGRIVHHKAYGYHNLESHAPLQEDAIFRIASQTKAITSVAVMMLYEEGRLLLDDPVADYIPAFANQTVLVKYDEKNRSRYETRPAKRPVTIRHLLAHTAGIPYGHPLESLPAFAAPELHTTGKVLLADAVARIAARPLLHDPGEKYTYGLNTDVLGYLVEVVSGQPLDVFFQQRIFAPLGMTDTYFYLPAHKAARLVELYAKPTHQAALTRHESNEERSYPVSGAKTYFSGGAGLVSTISDYARFCQMLLNGGTFNHKRLLGAATVALMARNQIGEMFVWDRKDKFGLGFQIATDSTAYLDPAAPGTLMWGGAYSTEYTIDPHENMILLIFTNVRPFAQSTELLKKFRVSVYQALEPDAKPAPAGKPLRR